MSELGNETTTAVFKLGEKSLEVLMKLLQFLIERREKKINSEIQKEKLNDMKLESGQRKARLKVENKTGFVKAKLLQKTGEPLVAVNISLNDNQMKDFARYAKKYGIPYTSISNQRKEGEKVHTFFVREKDLSTTKAITDRMTEDLQLKSIDGEMEKIYSKGDLTEKDIKDIEFLRQQKENIIRGGTTEFNNENAEIIFNDVSGNMQNKSMSFDRAMNRFTDRDFSQEEPYYICERTNPTNYIELNSTLDEFAGEEYTRTDYKVYKNNIQQVADLTNNKDGEFTDKRFEGRPRGYWQTLKAEMKTKGNLSDDIVIFNTKDEFQRYQELYKIQQREISVLEQGEQNRDYSSIIEELENQLKLNKAEIVDEVLIDKRTQKPILESVFKDREEEIKAVESLVIFKQIKNYSLLTKTEVKLAMDKLEFENTPVNTKEYNVLKISIEEGEQKIRNGLAKEGELIKQRSSINGIQAVTEVEKEYTMKKNEKDIDISEHDTEIIDDNLETETVEQWKEKIENKKEADIHKNKGHNPKNKDKGDIDKDGR